MDYNLTNLGSLDFENMVAALFERTFGPKVGQFGIGPDGGREATYEGKLTSVGEDPVDWDGYVVLQAKFRARPLGTAPDQNWLIKAITDELREWDSATSERRKAGDIPDYLVIASNVVLTPVAGSGGIDKLEKALSVLASRVGVKGWLVWHHDKLCRMLDDAPGIRRTYAALLTSGDVLSQLLDNLEGDAAHLENVLRAFTGQTLIHQRHVRLTESGGTGNLTLEQVGVDLPCSNVKGSEARTAIQALIDVGDTDLRANFERRGDALATHLLVGGPGQGKSTLSNLLAQVYRVALLMDEPGRNGPQAEQIINDSLETWKQAGLRLPRKRRWPLRIDLAQVTIDGSLFKNITALVRHRTGTKVTAPELISWFQQWPWLIILDGFDEVASADARTKVQDSVLGFLSDAATYGCDLLTVITTRPQGYDNEFDVPGVARLELAPLERKRALEYARRFAGQHFGDDADERDQVLHQLREASLDENISRLLQTPLQATIMTLLLADHGHAPRDRFRLFDAYYQTIYKREAAKPVSLSGILDDHRPDIQFLHEQSGLLLQSRSEQAGGFDAAIPREELRQLIIVRLESSGYSTDEAVGVAEKLWRAATDRLVLLVPHGEGIGFELRSIQEYMAARALTSGPDAIILERLHRVAASAHWRNAWLFAFARTLQEREHLRAQLVTLIRVPNEDPLARRLGVGVELAAALTTEGAGANVPILRQELLTTILEAFSLPPLPFDVSRALSLLAGERPVFKSKVFQALRAVAISGRPDTVAAAHSILDPLARGNGPLGVASRATLAKLKPSAGQALAIANTRDRYDQALNSCTLVPLSQFIPVELAEVLDGDEAAAARKFVSELAKRRVPVTKLDDRVVVGASGAARSSDVTYPTGEDTRLAIETCLAGIHPESWGAAVEVSDSLWRTLRRTPVGHDLDPQLPTAATSQLRSGGEGD